MDDGNPRSDGRPAVVHVVNSLTGGGTERTLVSLLRRFPSRAMRHVVVTMREAGAGAVRLPEHVACCALGLRGPSRLAFLRLIRVARSWNTAILHARNTGCWWDTALAARMIPGARAVLGFHGLDRSEPAGAGPKRIVRWLAQRDIWFTSVSQDGARKMRETWGVSPGRITVLSNGVDLKRFHPVDGDARRQARNQLELPQNAFVIGAVGSLVPIKRFDLLLDAFAASRARNHHAHVLIAGDGPLRDALNDRARDLGIADRFHAVGVIEEVPDFLAACDAYVCCSDFEGISNALLEAMACALPVITTRVGDHADLVRDGVEGLTVERNNVRELAEAIDRLALDGEVRAVLGAAARSRVSVCDLDHTVRDYERFYESLIEHRHETVIAGHGTSDTRRLRHWPQASG